MNCAERLFQGKVAWHDSQSISDRVSLLSAIRDATAVDIQNVHDYLERACMQKPITIDDFPEAIPPFSNGLLFFRARDLRDTEFAILLHSGAWADVMEPVNLEVPNPDGDCRYAALGSLWMSLRDSQVCRTVGTIALGYTGSGDVAVSKNFIVDNLPTEVEDGTRGILNNAANMLVAACSFANCKNTILEKAHVSRQVRRHAQRRSEPVFEYYQLRIEPVQRILEDQGGLLQHGDIKRSLHICRGHFSRYGAQYGKGKLFGKLEGRFWVAQHLKGSPERGVVSKSYSIGSP